MKYHYECSEMVCSQSVDVELTDDGKNITRIRISGGCPGNLAGISSLLRGMPVDYALERLSGIRCGGKPTSCPDQIAQAIKACLAQKQA